MRKILVIGIGAGNPEHVTVQAIRALNAADVFFVLDKGGTKAELVRIRREICERYIEGHSYRFVEAVDPDRDRDPANYGVAVDDWHAARARLIEALIEENLGERECGAFLVWGDPALYDSTLRILDRILANGRLAFSHEVIPGITSIQALAASHRITFNRIGEPVLITTGRRLRSEQRASVESTVVMLDGDPNFDELDPDLTIYWGGNLGTGDESIISGRLGDVGQTIRAARQALRSRHGWIMDTYLLRRAES